MLAVCAAASAAGLVLGILSCASGIRRGYDDGERFDQVTCGDRWYEVLDSFSGPLREWLVLGATRAEHVHDGLIFLMRSESVMAGCNTLPRCLWNKRANFIRIFKPGHMDEPLYYDEWCGGVIARAGWPVDGWLTVWERELDGSISERVFEGW